MRAKMAVNVLRGRFLRPLRLVVAILGATGLLWATPGHAQRDTQSLDGTWQIAESVSGKAAPSTYPSRVAVPGLVHSAEPRFSDTDAFDSREYIGNEVMAERLPRSALVTSAGTSHQKRNYFWYRTEFAAPKRRELARLTFALAQFGFEAYVNGRRVGGHIGCSSSATFDISRAVRWEGRNELVVRVGAHPGVLPPGNPCGVDFEKRKWTPGIYDSVLVAYSDAAAIEGVQIAPRLDPKGILVEAHLVNRGIRRATVPLILRVHQTDGSGDLGHAEESVVLAPGESRAVRAFIALPDAALWSPETPQLYQLETRLPGDRLQTRFGVREFRFDTATKRAYLNGKPYFLRGTNIALHRFFEDPQSDQLPWTDRWLRKLLVDNFKAMHWNSMRITLGPVPQRWLDLADEAGILVQYEYPIWQSSPRKLPDWLPVKPFDKEQLKTEFAGWMADNWNHPSIAVWDASNETESPMLAEEIVPAVRELDLSNRPWDNGYSPPHGPDDPVEDHPYEYNINTYPAMKETFDMTRLEQDPPTGRLSMTPATGHAMVINEYGWLWLNRDGTPTLLTRNLYPELPYPHATAEERFATSAYLVAGLTEYWRSRRTHAGVQHFVYLTNSGPDSYTSDNFSDLASATLEPHFADFVGEAFKPLGVYLNFWRRELAPAATNDFQVMLIDDDLAGSRGMVDLYLEDEKGRRVAVTRAPFALAGNGQQTLFLKLKLPEKPGPYWLKAEARPEGGRPSTVSRRMLTLRTP